MYCANFERWRTLHALHWEVWSARNAMGTQNDCCFEVPKLKISTSFSITPIQLERDKVNLFFSRKKNDSGGARLVQLLKISKFS